jgi:hypothetical protein
VLIKVTILLGPQWLISLAARRHVGSFHQLAVVHCDVWLLEARSVGAAQKIESDPLGRDAEYSLTGIATSPKEIVREAIERACGGMITPSLKR